MIHFLLPIVLHAKVCGRVGINKGHILTNVAFAFLLVQFILLHHLNYLEVINNDAVVGT
jgi:hypothetical protein